MLNCEIESWMEENKVITRQELLTCGKMGLKRLEKEKKKDEVEMKEDKRENETESKKR